MDGGRRSSFCLWHPAPRRCIYRIILRKLGPLLFGSPAMQKIPATLAFQSVKTLLCLLRQTLCDAHRTLLKHGSSWSVTLCFCIDLDAYKQGDLALHFMEKYQALFPEILISPFDQALFLYYKIYRANIRAKVLLLKAAQNQDLKKGKKKLNEVIIYLKLMDQYLSSAQ